MDPMQDSTYAKMDRPYLFNKETEIWLESMEHDSTFRVKRLVWESNSIPSVALRSPETATLVTWPTIGLQETGFTMNRNLKGPACCPWGSSSCVDITQVTDG
jgi:hypothetical protein